MLSLTVHLCIFLLVMLWLSRPRPVEPERFIVLDLGTPVESEVVTNAPATQAPAPQAPVPQVADDDTGEPQARTSEAEQSAVPEPTPATQQPPAQPRTEEAQDQQEQLRAEDQPAEVQTEPQAALPPTPVPPAREPAGAELPDLPLDTTATVLPEIDPAELTPAPADRPITIPTPRTRAQLPETRNVAAAPAVEVAPPAPVPTPRISTRVAEASEVPVPQLEVQVTAATPVPTPPVVTNVTEALEVPLPEATARVSEASAVPTPRVEAQVARGETVPTPQVSASTAGARDIPMPGVNAQVSEARPMEVAPQIAVTMPLQVPAPQVAGRVTAPEIIEGAAMAGAAPAGAAENPSNRLDDRRPGGNADRTSQDVQDPDAQAGNLGVAAAPDGGEGSGAPVSRAPIPFRQERNRPLAVLLDNANGYPQRGLWQASVIVEMPVEGGLTRLMALFDQTDPRQVGPIRSARDYFVQLAMQYDAVLVHDGGSPAALASIEQNSLVTINAFTSGELFSRGQGSAPYNLYSDGVSLREAINRLRLDQLVEQRGLLPQPPEDATTAQTLEVAFSSVYSSGFSYLQELDLYRWRRNGENARDAEGRDVTAHAVLVARVDARPYPNDPEGRLYIPLRGGEADLFLRGRHIPGSWSLDGGRGVLFRDAAGEEYDLRGLQTWMLFAPDNARLSFQ